MGFFINYFLLPTVLVLVCIRKYRSYKWGKCTNKIKLQKKIVIITGGNSGIGYEVAKELAGREAHVIIACRNLNLASNAILKIKGCYPNSEVIPIELDLASLKSVKKFADNFKSNYSQLDLLINNAGVAYPTNASEQTKDGLEIHFGTNHLGHFFLTNLLIDELKAAKSSRVIIVSSQLHEGGCIDIDDLNMEKFNKITGYPNSKLANMYHCQELSKRLHGTGVNVYALCPGWVYTNLFRHHTFKWYQLIFILPVAFLFMRSPKQGAQTVIYCATEPQLDNESGCMYRDCNKYTSKVTFDPLIPSRLWDLSENIIDKVMS